MGLAQHRRFPELLKRRDSIASFYRERLQHLPVELPLEPSDGNRVYYRYVVKGPRSAQHHLARFQARGVVARRPVFQPLHRYLGLEGFPGADEAWERAVSLPLYPALSDAEVERIAQVAQESFDEA